MPSTARRFPRATGAWSSTGSSSTAPSRPSTAPTPVGITSIYSFQLSVPGQEVLPAAGVTFVAVLPTYRRRGVLSSMMRRQLADVRDRGEPLAVLWASESGIYSRYGYGQRQLVLSFTFRRGEGALAEDRPPTGGLRLRIAEPAGAPCPSWPRSTTPCCRHALGSSGATTRGGGARSTTRRRSGTGASPLRCLLAEDASGPRGYALYSGVDDWARLPAGKRADRARADGGRSRRQRGALGRPAQPGSDQRVPRRRRPVDDPLLYQLADPRRARPQLTDGLWVRIVDVPARAGRAQVFRARSTWSSRCGTRSCRPTPGRWRLTTTGDTGGDGLAASCVPATSAADLALHVTELGAAYLGGTRLGALAGAGLVTELRPGAVRQLSAAMSWDPAPWCPLVF